MSVALTTDRYELTMAASYLSRGMTESATFSLFVRDLPPDRGFVVAAGLEDVLEILENFAFDHEDLAWLAGHGFDRGALDDFATLRFTGDVWAIPEGHVVFANEPLLEVTAPLPEAQIVESIILNQITYQTALATKAARDAKSLPTAGRHWSTSHSAARMASRQHWPRHAPQPSPGSQGPATLMRRADWESLP